MAYPAAVHPGAAPQPRAGHYMEIILHLGAHRSASTSFQHYLRKNGARLAAGGVGVWGPPQTRNGLLEGVLPRPGLVSYAAQMQRARGRIALALADIEMAGIERLIVTDENMIGTPRSILRAQRLYPGAGERMARYAAGFGGRITRVVLSVRAQDAWWASCIAYAVARGARVPSRVRLTQIAADPRTWRDVICDLACALPGVEIQVMPHEVFASRPEARLQAMARLPTPPKTAAREWLNRAPELPALRQVIHDRGGDPALLPDGDGPWQPFTREERTALREAYHDDLFWLRAGADGFATLTEEPDMDQVGPTLPIHAETRGRDHDQEGARRLAQAGRS
ncbi:hypothetical protein [Roseovarius nanhaiticus]|uniref:hypothetical protein n=1 Tax=Roseovarius nanhaiticus TaxID=573024 RepID=UPI0024901A8F|nr:hypothetical protein [Roseovarius nanhaiticus]